MFTVDPSIVLGNTLIRVCTVILNQNCYSEGACLLLYSIVHVCMVCVWCGILMQVLLGAHTNTHKHVLARTHAHTHTALLFVAVHSNSEHGRTLHCIGKPTPEN